ncbi:uncharacterized protein LOC136029539 isoform X1 [Artemia franciscana]|uniref:uncharacterized protein LOC136029539 isoform X1 n=1 Tax=Artemia franciscana TaxID=6661 RepID=UPI0032DB8F39
MQLKRHYEFLTQTAPGNQVNRSRFWTHYMRGVHGDMDTRYDASAPTGSRRARASSLPPRSRSAGRSGRASSASLRFRPELSNTYGFTPRDWTGDYAPSVEYEPDLKPYRPSADYTPRPSAVDKLKGFDEPDFSVPSRYLRNHPIGLEVDGLLNGERPLFQDYGRGLANRLWRPDLFDNEYTPYHIRDPWWYRYPQLRPVERWWWQPSSYIRSSYLSPHKKTYVWSTHPFRYYHGTPSYRWRRYY